MQFRSRTVGEQDQVRFHQQGRARRRVIPRHDLPDRLDYS